MYKNYKNYFIFTSFITLFSIILIFAICDFVIKNVDFIIVDNNIPETIYVKKWIEQKKIIAKNKHYQGKKLFFLGGSSTLFGIYTKDIENYFNIPTINFGLHAGYNRINFYIAKKFLNKGDIVVIPLEYHSYKKSYLKSLDTLELAYLFLYDKKSYRELNINNKYSAIIYFLCNIINIKKPEDIKTIEINSANNSSYSTKYWNKNGDSIYTRKNNKEKIEEYYKIATYKEKYFKKDDIEYIRNKDSYINDFLEFAKENNIKVYFIAPVFLVNKSKSNIHNINIKELWDSSNLNYLDNFKDCFYPKEYFYDTNYHLTNEGVKLRTNQIIKLLEKSNILSE